MKNLLFVSLMIILDVLGCGRRHIDHVEEPYLAVNNDVVELDSVQDARGVISLSSNTRWTVQNKDGSWLEVTPLSGKGNAQITVTALSSNESTYKRSGIIIISGVNEKLQVLVYQKGKKPVDN